MRNKQRGRAFMFDKLEFCCFYSEVRVLANSQTLQTRELCHFVFGLNGRFDFDSYVELHMC